MIKEELQKLSSIENLVDKKIYFMGLLTKELEKKEVQPIVVGVSAVDFYTEGIYPSYDIDLVGNRKIIGEILEKVFDFKPGGRHWINEQIGLSVEIPDSRLAGDKDKVTVIRIGDLRVYVIGIEDLIIDCITTVNSEKMYLEGEFFHNKLLLKPEDEMPPLIS
ncbi:hypothetical protein ig2599ANME_0758 [groundwater metagenome]